MERPQELFFLTKHHPLSAFLTKNNFFFNSQKKHSKFGYRNLQISKQIMYRVSE